MVPTKEQFQALREAGEADRLGSLIRLISGRESETGILAMLKGYEMALDAAFLNQIKPLPAYTWLEKQTAFVRAERRAFRKCAPDSLELKANAIITLIELRLQEQKSVSIDRKVILRRTMKEAAEQMQRRHYWIACIARALAGYHHPATPDLGKMWDKLSSTQKVVSDATRAIREISQFSEYVAGLPLPDLSLLRSLENLCDFLRPESVRELTPIKRANESFMERLFVAHLADLHARILCEEDGMPVVIADLFYLDGFANGLDERTIRRICVAQRERRDRAKSLIQVPVSTAARF